MNIKKKKQTHKRVPKFATNCEKKLYYTFVLSKITTFEGAICYEILGSFGIKKWLQSHDNH